MLCGEPGAVGRAGEVGTWSVRGGAKSNQVCLRHKAAR